MATDSENRGPNINADDTSDFDELAARAGAALRRPAPEHGSAEIIRRGRRRRVATALAAGGTALVLIAVGIALAGRDSSTREPISPVATTVVEERQPISPDDTLQSTSTTITTDPAAALASLAFTPPGAATHGALFMPDGRVLVDLGSGLVIWDVANNRQLDEFGQGGSEGVPPPPGISPAVSPDGAKVLYHNALWDSSTGELIASSTGFGGMLPVSPLAPFNPDSTQLTRVVTRFVTLSRDEAVAVFGAVPPDMGPNDTINTGKESVLVSDIASGDDVSTREVEADSGHVWFTSFSPDGSKVVTSGFSAPRVLDAATGRELLRIQDDYADPVMAIFSPDGAKLLTMLGTSSTVPLDEGLLRVRDATTGDLLYELDTDQVPLACFSPDGSKLMVSDRGPGPRVSILDAETGHLMTTIETVSPGPLEYVGCAAFSPDGTMIVTSLGTEATVWDAATGQQRSVVTAAGDVVSAAFSPDGASIVTATGADGVRVWPLSPSAPKHSNTEGLSTS